MKHILATLTLFATLVVTAQTPITKTVGEFSILKAYDLINVEMIKSDINKVEITGKNAHDVVVVNRNGKLKIKMNLEESYDGNDTHVKLYFTNVDIIDANEGAFISSNDTFNQYELELKAQEGGQIKLNIETKETVIKAVSGGIVELTGSTKNQNISVNTGGILKSKSFTSETAKVNVKAGGDVDVNASESVDVKIKAGGDVNIYGNPRTVSENRVLGGRIKRMD
jgi:hypothetical protein